MVCSESGCDLYTLGLNSKKNKTKQQPSHDTIGTNNKTCMIPPGYAISQGYLAELIV